jgi:hypothetical protein
MVDTAIYNEFISDSKLNNLFLTTMQNKTIINISILFNETIFFITNK